MSFVAKSTLPRLGREFYQGHAMVLWTHTFEQRASGWLTDTCHQHFREILLHACGRYALATPCYVLMPDHWHIVWVGLDEKTDQLLATSFLRKNLRIPLGDAALQDRAHDHVLREDQRERGAFEAACTYVGENPQRAQLCDEWRSWRFLGGMVAGYPDMDPRAADYWNDFWKIHARLIARQLSQVARRGSGGTERKASASDPCAPAQGYKEGGGKEDELVQDPCAPAQGYEEGGGKEDELVRDPCAPAQGYEEHEVVGISALPRRDTTAAEMRDHD